MPIINQKCFVQRKQTLIWKPNVGQITMDIILNNEVLSFTVNPIHATIIWHFQKQGIYFLSFYLKVLSLYAKVWNCILV